MSIKDYQNSRVKTKEQLKEELQKYQMILSKPMVEYLNHLIALDFSVIRKYISDEERLALSELEIYRATVIYNIYYKAIKLLQQTEIGLSIETPLEVQLTATTEIEKEKIRLFKFDFEKAFSIQIPDNCRSTHIGTIQLYQSIEDEETRNQEIESLQRNIERLEHETNPFLGLTAVCATRWSISNTERIELYKSQIKKLSNQVLTEVDRKKIKYTNYIYSLFMEDYGLSEEEFIEYVPKHKLTELQKEYVKKMPNLQIIKQVNNQ